ncbi:MAG: GrpB family protein [Bryobacteraceae bacterium]
MWARAVDEFGTEVEAPRGSYRWGILLPRERKVKEDAPVQSHGGRAPLTEEYLRAHTVGEPMPLSCPIRVVDYDFEWPRRFELEVNRIGPAMGDRALRVEHVGSTSVPDLPAKPIIDILLVVTDSAEETEYAPALERAGYRLHIREPGWHEHRMFKSGETDVNLHVFSAGCTEIDRMLAFRDWLRSNASDHELYANAKRALAQQDWKYAQNYADAKTSVIEEIISRMQRNRVGLANEPE